MVLGDQPRPPRLMADDKPIEFDGIDITEFISDAPLRQEPVTSPFEFNIKGYFPCEQCGYGHDPDRACPPPCQAMACPACGICATCQDFHFYGGGCTPERCPLQLSPQSTN